MITVGEAGRQYQCALEFHRAAVDQDVEVDDAAGALECAERELFAAWMRHNDRDVCSNGPQVVRINRKAGDGMNGNSWKPTKKWLALVAGGAASIAASWIVTGGFDDVEQGMAATLLVAAVGAYFKSNDQTASGDGVPAR